MARIARKTLPTLEHLEERKLLNARIIAKNGQPINDKDLRRAQVQLVNLRNGSKVSDRRLTFHTPDGHVVLITLYGQGTLKGSFQDPDGALNILYDNTNSSSQITARVSHGGTAPLRTLRDADVDINSLSGVGSNQLAAVRFDPLDLVDNGRINVSGGVDFLRLRDVGANTVIDARSLPLTASDVNPSPSSPQPQLQFVDTGNGTELAGVGGLTTPGSGSGTTTTTTTTEEPGLSIVVKNINGQPRATPLANPQFFGYDPTSQQLIRFDARTGGVLGSIAVPNNGANETGVGLGRVGRRQVVLVGTGNLVRVYDVLTNDLVGSFLTNTLPGFNVVTGIGQTDRNVELSDSTANIVQTINVARSLAAGHAVAAGPASNPSPPFTPTREFVLSGGATGVGGLSNNYLTGAAHFDTFVPNQTQFGILTVTTVNDRISETARTQVSTPSTLINDVPPGNTPFALGSDELSLALVTAVDPAAGTNTVTLYNPTNMAAVGTVALRWPNRLTGLSESFHPELVGAAVVNVGGIVKRFQVLDQATGLVVNTIGFLNQITAPRVTDSAFVAEPIGHVNIGQRQNVSIISSSNRASSQGGVFREPGLRPLAPLAPPS